MYTKYKPSMQSTINIKNILGILLVVALFVTVSYLAQQNAELIKSFIQNDGPVGMIIYVTFTAFAIVAAPVSSLPLLPIASLLWGWKMSATLSILGWTLGSQIAFILSRSYGKPFVKKIITLEKIERYEKSLPKKNLFWVVVLLRMIVPVDLLSYVLGLFSKIDSMSYLFATLIGVTPFAFIFAYVGTLPPIYYIVLIPIFGILMLFLGKFKSKFA